MAKENPLPPVSPLRHMMRHIHRSYPCQPYLEGNTIGIMIISQLSVSPDINSNKFRCHRKKMKKFSCILAFLVVIGFYYKFYIVNPEEFRSPVKPAFSYAYSYFNTVTVDVFIIEFSPHSAPDINGRPEKSNQADSLFFKNSVTEAVRKKFGTENILIGGYEDPYTFLSNPFNLVIKLYVSRDLNEDRVNYQLKIIRSNLFSIFLRGLTSEKEMSEYNNISPALANEMLKTENPFVYWEKNAFFSDANI